MKNHKGQVSLDKKAKTKKDDMKNNKKITEFFSNYINGINTNNTDEDLSPYGKKENDINVKGEEELVQEEKFIELLDDDDSSLNSNNANRIYNNSNKKKLKKKMEEKKK
jgi:hypothetical protein